MTKIIPIRQIDMIEDDFIIENPDSIQIECLLYGTPRVMMTTSIDFKEAENLQRFHNEFDCNLRMASIKVKSNNIFRYYYEFYECTELDIHPILDVEHYVIKFKCIHFDVMKKDNGIKIRNFDRMELQ
jgi:hypothetical protein